MAKKTAAAPGNFASFALGNVPPLTSPDLGSTWGDLAQLASSAVKGFAGQKEKAAEMALKQAQMAAEKQQADAAAMQAGSAQLRAQTEAAGLPSLEAERAAQGRLSAASAGHLEAQTKGIAAGQEPAGEDQVKLMQYFLPKATPDMISGMSRASADAFIQKLVPANVRYSSLTPANVMNGGNSALGRFYRNPAVTNAIGGADAYRNIKALLEANASIGTTELLASFARLGLPNNARGVGVVLSAMKQKGLLSGPLTSQENFDRLMRQLSNPNGEIPLDPVTKQGLVEAAKAMMRGRMSAYDQTRRQTTMQMQQQGLPFGEDFLGDDLEDLRPELMGTNPYEAAYQAGGGH